MLPSERDLRSLRSILERSNWTLHTATTVAEAMRQAKQNVTPVILCECELPDGNWKDLLQAFADSDEPPQLVVTSRLADCDLWAEVLNLGGFDVLSKPFNAAEVFRVLSAAWRHWYDRARLGRRAPVALAAR